MTIEPTTTTPSNSPGRGARRASRSLVLLATIVLSTLTLIGPDNPAGATAWNPTVTLQGSAICKSSRATWVWVEASNGERGWATNGSGAYRFTFRRVPTSGMTVRVNYGNSTFSCTTKFGVNRPAVGTTATRNVIQIY